MAANPFMPEAERQAVAEKLRRVSAQAEPTVALVRADRIPIEPRRWLWRDYLPTGLLTVLGGPPSSGKTTLALAMAATVTCGGRWPDGGQIDEPGDVLVWTGEDDNHEVRTRLEAAGADLTRVQIISGLSTGAGLDAFDPARDIPHLESAARSLATPKLLILDPIVQAVSGDAHKSSDVRRALQPVVDFARTLGCAVIGITHFSKGTAGRDPVERVTGSIAFAALARMVLVATKVNGDGVEKDAERRVMTRAKCNIGPEGGGFAYQVERIEVQPGVTGQRVRWLEQLQGTARDLLADAEAPADEDGNSKADIEAFIRDMLADGPVPTKQFQKDAEGAGYVWRTVQRHAKRMGVTAHKDGMRGGWSWSFLGTAKATTRPEVAEGDSLQTVTTSAPSTPSVTPSGECNGAGDDEGALL